MLDRRGLGTPGVPAPKMVVTINPLRIEIVYPDGWGMAVPDTDTGRMSAAALALTEHLDALLTDRHEEALERVRIAT